MGRSTMKLLLIGLGIFALANARQTVPHQPRQIDPRQIDPRQIDPRNGTCGAPQWKGDNYCDDENNNEGCDFDGGDCCGDNVQTQYCSACECLEPECGSPQWKGDNYCDDENNNARCDWDGGDCCGTNVNTNYCQACQCLDPNQSSPTPAPPSPSPAPGPSPPAGECASMPTFMQNAPLGRIVGGEEAPSMIPWQVYIWGCGGTILDECTILSAAHCGFTNGQTKYIRAGSINKNDGGQIRSFSTVISNNQYPYNGATTNNDWVILKLDTPLELNSDVQPACLPSSSDYLSTSSTEQECYTSGWGTTSSGGSSPTNLRYVNAPAITNAQCNSAYGGAITDAMLCGGFPGVGGKDACQGDSGGPYVCNDGGKAVVAGVVSWGYGCAHPNYPGVYARNTLVLDWIKANMGSCSGMPGR